MTAPPASTQSLGVGGWLIVGYLAITRIGHMEAAKIGITLGPVPLFLTDMLVIASLFTAILSRPIAVGCWLATGGLCGLCGQLLWLLVIVSIIYAATAIQQWGVLALRDLAVFSYGMMFALTYLLLDTREKAAIALKWFAYCGTILAILLIGDTLSGAHLLFSQEIRFVTSERLAANSFGGGDVGGIVSFSLMSLIAYAIASPDRRPLNMVCAGLCFFALVIGQTRSAVFGVALSAIYCFIGLRATQRVTVVVLGIAALLAMLAIPVLAPTSTLARSLLGFTAAVQGGASLSGDDNFYFRMLRWDAVLDLWRNNPIFGVGFGRPIIPVTLLATGETGQFNAGLPHNTYLTVLARMGLFGAVLVLLPWLYSIGRGLRHVHRRDFGADAFAAGAALVCMAGFASFVLFLERPLHAATLWIIAAIACRLAENGATEPVPVATGAPFPVSGVIARAQQIARQKGRR